MALSSPFNPLDVSNIGVTLAIELLQRPEAPLRPIKEFPGAGVYAIYYRGTFKPYASMAKANRERLTLPIYIGSAVRSGAKTGFKSTPEHLPRLYKRLVHHAESIDAAGSLKIRDFYCRYLVLDDAFILLAESVLIGYFRPLWNGMGFGSKVVGANRMDGKPSKWDTLHPGREGRPSANAKAEADARANIAVQIKKFNERPVKDAGFARMYDRISRFL
jgi:hypothetical protein